MVLAAWQFAPVTTTQDSIGNVRIDFGYGGGRFEQTAVDCSGEVIGATRARYSSGGVSAEVWPSDRLRISGFGSRQTIDDEFEVSGTGAAVYPETIDYHGVQFAWEGQRFGLGFGTMRGEGESIRPAHFNSYLRIGDIDRAHFRTDYNNPSALFGTLGTIRLGIERNTGHLRGPAWFAGVASCQFCGETSDFSAFGALRLPVAGPFEATMQGLIGSAKEGSVASWGVGLRASF
jgi:hypothetical protein